MIIYIRTNANTERQRTTTNDIKEKDEGRDYEAKKVSKAKYERKETRNGQS